MTSEHVRGVAEQIAGDSSCAQGEFHQRVSAILPYLSEIDRLRPIVEQVATVFPWCNCERCLAAREALLNADA